MSFIYEHPVYLFILFIRVPSIGTSSIYHDANLISESRIFAMPDTGLERGNNNNATCNVSQVLLSHINAQNRHKVVSHLFSVFSYMLGALTKECLEWSCRASSRMIIRYSNYYYLSSIKQFLFLDILYFLDNMNRKGFILHHLLQFLTNWISGVKIVLKICSKVVMRFRFLLD